MERLYIISIPTDQQDKVIQLTDNFKFRLFYISFQGNISYFNFKSNKTQRAFANRPISINTLYQNIIHLLKIWEFEPYEDITLSIDTIDNNGKIVFIGVKEDV
ncbi:MAG: hypothetical protein QW156_04585 [Candidatus Aenigmatarchaeota archaeon]